MPTLLAPYGLAGQLGWVAAGLGTLLVVLCLARLAKRDPKLGGPYAYVRSGMGDYAGFIVPGLIGYRVWPHVRESQLRSLDIWVSSILDYLNQLSPVT